MEIKASKSYQNEDIHWFNNSPSSSYLKMSRGVLKFKGKSLLEKKCVVI